MITSELIKDDTTEKYSVIQTEGKRKVNRQVLFYNLDSIISVRYKVNLNTVSKVKTFLIIVSMTI